MASEDKLGEAVLFLSTKAKDLIEGIDKAKLAADNLQSHFNKVSSLISGALATVGIGFSLSKVVQATIEAEDAFANLDAAVQSTNASAGFTTKQLQLQAQALQQVTRFGDEAIMKMQATLLAFQNVQGEVFVRAQQAVLDFAQATGRDAADAARTLGLALNDPVQGVSMLRRAGVSLSAAMRVQIATLAENGELLRAQNLLLDEFARAYGRRATTAVNTLGGALDQLRERFGDVFLELDVQQTGPLVSSIQWLTRNLGNISAIMQAAFVGVNSVLKGVAENINRVITALVYLGQRQLQSAVAELGELKGGMDIVTDAAKDSAAAFVKAHLAMAMHRNAMQGALLVAPKLRDALETASEKGLRAAEAARESALKASDAVAKAYKEPLVDAEQTFDRLMEHASVAATKASLVAQTARDQAAAGLTEQAEMSRRLAETYSRDAERFANQAIASKQRLQSAMNSLKLSTANAVGGMVAQFALGQMKFQEFVKQMIVLIGQLMVKILILKTLGMGLGGQFAGGLAGGLFGGIGGLAKGGPAEAGKPYVVGEEGPELMVPDRSGTIVPNDQLPESGPRITQNFNFSGMDYSSAEAARKIARQIAAQLRAGAVEALAMARASADQVSLQPRRSF